MIFFIILINLIKLVFLGYNKQRKSFLCVKVFIQTILITLEKANNKANIDLIQKEWI